MLGSGGGASEPSRIQDIVALLEKALKLMDEYGYTVAGAKLQEVIDLMEQLSRVTPH